MDRFSYLLRKHTEKQEHAKKVKTLFAARHEVDINANGTSGYQIKHGANKGKILEHISVKHRNSSI